MDQEEFLKMRDISNIRTHADEQEPAERKTEGTYHYRKGKIHA